MFQSISLSEKVPTSHVWILGGTQNDGHSILVSTNLSPSDTFYKIVGVKRLKILRLTSGSSLQNGDFSKNINENTFKYQ